MNKGNVRAAWAAVKVEMNAIGVLMEFADNARDPHTQQMGALAVLERMSTLADLLAELEAQLDI